jgi:peroxiredoxin
MMRDRSDQTMKFRTTTDRARKMALTVLITAACLVPYASASGQMPPTDGATPKVGDRARDFALQSLDGATVRLSEEASRGPLVLVVLRGWPGYQCPFCTRQFGDYLANAAKFDEAGARVLFVYPGPGDGLIAHAEAFTAGRALPSAFRILLDPGYTFTQAYALRWEAANETAYPSTFVINKDAVVTFAQTSRSHGDRVTAESVLKALAAR